VSSRLSIATRGSALALWQANHVRDRLIAAAPGLEVELVIIKTKGDKILDVPLARVGGKGLFVKEIEEALVDGRADLAVHSMKDVPAELTEGLIMAAVSEREDPRDALCTTDGTRLEGLAPGARVGTSSPRRSCQIMAARPDLETAPLRGNVPTRLQKLDDGKYDAIVLAAAGLVRLGRADRISQHFEPTECLPAVGQGALGLETRAADDATIDLVRRAIHHDRDATRVAAERAFLSRMGGGCETPVAAFATYDGDELVLDAMVGRLDGTEILRAHRRGDPGDASEIGELAADDVLSRGAGAIIEELIEAARSAD